MINVASGYKLLSVLQTLYTKDYLDYNTILLLDEPEVYMHPELMLDFAEFLLKLINENLVKIVITTHSPLLIEALKYQQIKITKYDNDLIRYYELSGKIGENKAHDKTNRIEDIYERFNKPFYHMEED
jgi:predicted ATP-dependent endonuclease of OLD family